MLHKKKGKLVHPQRFSIFPLHPLTVNGIHLLIAPNCCTGSETHQSPSATPWKTEIKPPHAVEMATEKEYDNWFARGYKPHTYNTHTRAQSACSYRNQQKKSQSQNTCQSTMTLSFRRSNESTTGGLGRCHILPPGVGECIPMGETGSVPASTSLYFPSAGHTWVRTMIDKITNQSLSVIRDPWLLEVCCFFLLASFAPVCQRSPFCDL